MLKERKKEKRKKEKALSIERPRARNFAVDAL
jgi:hypothetical protein